MATESVYVFGDDDRRKFARLVAQTWSDDAARTRYASEPRPMLAEYGIAFPAGVPTPVLPTKPVGEFSIDELELVAGTSVAPGGSVGSATSGGCVASGCLGCSQSVGTVSSSSLEGS